MIPRFRGILACDSKGVIGLKGKIPWHIESELIHYRNTVKKDPLYMGYNTYLSLPSSALADRVNIVFSRVKREARLGCPTCFVSSWDEFLEVNYPDGWMIGGGQISRLFLDKNALYSLILTQLQSEYPGDVYFPLERIQNWSSRLLKQTPEYTIRLYENHTV